MGINTLGQALDPRDKVAQDSDASVGALNSAVGPKNDLEQAQSFFDPLIIIFASDYFCSLIVCFLSFLFYNILLFFLNNIV